MAVYSALNPNYNNFSLTHYNNEQGAEENI
jgi:hypothetical protein